ncbi:hypothetical protein ACFOZ4_27565 [Hamadaea flava]|uniref:Uncharacterized protein n=1 Tax=Hamadaea flava TaxID=1742688 RepID=A0ABV8LTJ5_9ACTN
MLRIRHPTVSPRSRTARRSPSRSTSSPNTGSPNTGSPNTGSPNTGSPNTGSLSRSMGSLSTARRGNSSRRPVRNGSRRPRRRRAPTASPWRR